MISYIAKFKIVWAKRDIEAKWEWEDLRGMDKKLIYCWLAPVTKRGMACAGNTNLHLMLHMVCGAVVNIVAL